MLKLPSRRARIYPLISFAVVCIGLVAIPLALTSGYLDTNGDEELAPSTNKFAEGEPIHEMDLIKSRDLSFPEIAHLKSERRQLRYLVAP